MNCRICGAVATWAVIIMEMATGRGFSHFYCAEHVPRRNGKGVKV